MVASERSDHILFLSISYNEMRGYKVISEQHIFIIEFNKSFVHAEL